MRLRHVRRAHAARAAAIDSRQAIFDPRQNLPDNLGTVMRRSAGVVMLLGIALIATAPGAAKTLPEKTALPDFVAFVQKAGGEPKEAVEESGRYTMTIGDIASAAFSEDTHEDQDINEIVQFVLRGTSRSCSAFRPTAVTREELDGMTLVRASVRCVLMGVELHGEELIIADPARYHSYSIGGPAQNRDGIAAIATRMFNALVATYR
jgi:hypothetical protein